LVPKQKNSRLFPVGRLDYDAQGALLITNDGDMAHKLMHPKFRCSKTYLVKVKGVPNDEDLEKLRRGVYLEDGPTGRSEISMHRKTKNNSWLEVSISQGRYRQIKRMFFRIKNPVMRILRIDFAGLPLGNLGVGEYRTLRKKEVLSLQEKVNPS
jgi:pseudouridine synthase